MGCKITVIGGGSSYTPGLVRSFLAHAEAFGGLHLFLYDIAHKELDIVGRLTRQMAQASGADATVTATTDRTEAIEGADFVLTSFRHGGFEARHIDESIPLAYNVLGQETIGPGGFFFAMRTIGEIKKIAAEMMALAPGATLVNYTNPTQIVAEVLDRYSNVPFVSICDQSIADFRRIVDYIGFDCATTDYEFTSVGVNHCTWSNRFVVNGQDGIALMMDAMDDVLARNDITDRVKRQFMLTKRYNSVPNSYMPYYLMRETTVAEALAAPKTRAQTIAESLPADYAHFEEQSKQAVPVLTRGRGGHNFGDMAVEVLLALVKKDGRIQTLNVRNNGALPDIDDARIVEVPCTIDCNGITALKQPPMAAETVGLVKMLAEYQRIAADVIWKEDKKALALALAANPLVLSLELADKLLNDAIPRISPWLPDGLKG